MQGMHVKGLISIYTLAEAKARPVSGKYVVERVEKATKGQWRLSPGSIYPLLRDMEAKGLLKPKLSPRGKGRREIDYELTAKGEKILADSKRKILTHMNKMFSTAVPLVARILHGAEDEEVIASVTAYTELSNSMRNQILSLPRERKLRAVKKISGQMRKLLASLQAQNRS